MCERPIVSLCISTNGVSEWVFPVLKSIYQQGIDFDLYEVIITDNGKSQEFKDKIKTYSMGKTNINYVQTEVLPFINQIESYKRARGKLIKFVNHRTLLVDGALQRLIDITRRYEKEKPIIYFSNGALRLSNIQYEYDTFDLFVRNLSYWSSWSTGMAIWKDDFDKISKDTDSFNELFPHTNILFAERNREKYIIDNTTIFTEIPQGNKNKGTYDLFGAFGVVYPGILYELLKNGDISKKTFRYITDKNLEFIASLYWRYFVKKEHCSYDLEGLNNIYGVFYTKTRLLIKLIKHAVKMFMKKLLKR